MKVLVIPADITKPFRLVELEGNENEQVDQMQGLVGGYFQTIPVPTQEITLWANEDGHNLPPNLRGSLLLKQLYGHHNLVTLVGDVFISGGTGADGDTLPVPDAIVKAMEAQQGMQDDEVDEM